MRGAAQKRCDVGDVLGREIHVRGERRGEPADLAPAHRVGLAGDRERRRAGLADAAGGEVDVDDRVDLVGAADRLVDALAEQRDRARVSRRTARRSARRSAGGRSQAARGRPQVAALVERFPEALRRGDVRVEEGLVEHAVRRGNRRAGRSSARRRCPGAARGAGRPPRRSRCGAGRSPPAWCRAPRARP